MQARKSRPQHFFEGKKQGFGNIDTSMSVLLLEAAWPRLRSKFAGAVRPAKPPKRPSRRPWLGRFFIQSLLALSDDLALRDIL
jgi:hypothetical protein